MKYFTDVHTIDDVKATYKKLVKELHPDNNGDAEAFKEMYQEYTKVFNLFKNVHVNANGETYHKETTETPEEFANIINKVINLQGITIEIIGSWVWLSGATMIHKDTIKEAGFWWSRSKKAWYYTGEKEHKKRRGHYNMNQLREKWGTQEIDPDPTPVLS